MEFQCPQLYLRCSSLLLVIERNYNNQPCFEEKLDTGEQPQQWQQQQPTASKARAGVALAVTQQQLAMATTWCLYGHCQADRRTDL